LDNTCGIYVISNKVNSKMYIGKSSDLYNRLSVHRKDLNLNKHYNDHLQNAWNKYGENNFDFSVLELINEEFIDSKEIFYIEFYKTNNPQYGYNKTIGGEGATGYKHTEEMKKQIGDSCRGKKWSQETKDRVNKNRIKNKDNKNDKINKRRIVHHFLVDYPNSNSKSSMEIYRMGIEGNIDEIRDYLYAISANVIFIKTSKESFSNSRGRRKIPCGIIRSCTYFTDMSDTRPQSFKLQDYDKRHKVV
jgi:group I intron endonuclease